MAMAKSPMKKSIKRRSDQQVSDKETAVILEELKKVMPLAVIGDVAEFGCYRGDTSLLIEKLLEEKNANRKLWI